MSISRKLALSAIAASGLALSTVAHAADTSTFNNVYLSYFSPSDVRAMANLASTGSYNLAGYIVWAVSGDTAPNRSDSLLNALKSSKLANQTVNGYYENWGTYKLDTPQMIAQLQGGYLSDLTYAFLEAKEGVIDFSNIGTNYQDPKTFASTVSSYGVKPLMALGGAGHNATFEEMFDGNGGLVQVKVNDFISGLKTLQSDGFAGVDFDYENQNMTAADSQSYVALLEAVNTAFSGQDFKFSVTIPGSAAFIDGTKAGGAGFQKGDLQTIANLSQVSDINLMTYDYFGSWNKSENLNTGFLANNYPVNGGQTADLFSVKGTVDAAIAAGVPQSKLTVGIPAYGRSMTGIQPGQDNTGYNQSTAAAGVPTGDLDEGSCSNSIGAVNACTGSYSYHYIVEHMLDQTAVSHLIAKDWQNAGSSAYNGSTAYANAYTQKHYALTITNADPNYGLNTVQVGDYQLSYMGPKTSVTLNGESNPTTLDLSGQSGLALHFVDTLGHAFNCAQALNLTQNMDVSVDVSAKSCTVTPAA